MIAHKQVGGRVICRGNKLVKYKTSTYKESVDLPLKIKEIKLYVLILLDIVTNKPQMVCISSRSHKKCSMHLNLNIEIDK